MLTALSTMLLMLPFPVLDVDSELLTPAAITEDAQQGTGTHNTPGGDKTDPKKPGHPIPEGATLLLVGSGLVGLAIKRRRERRGQVGSQDPAT